MRKSDLLTCFLARGFRRHRRTPRNRRPPSWRRRTARPGSCWALPRPWPTWQGGGPRSGCAPWAWCCWCWSTRGLASWMGRRPEVVFGRSHVGCWIINRWLAAALPWDERGFLSTAAPPSAFEDRALFVGRWLERANEGASLELLSKKKKLWGDEDEV